MLNERDKALVMFYLDQKIAEISTLKNSMNVCCSYTFAWSNANSDTQVKQFPGHMTDYILDRFTKEGVLSVFLAPHSSDQCQPLDLGIFGPQKKLHPSITVPAGVSTQTAQLCSKAFRKLQLFATSQPPFEEQELCQVITKKRVTQVTINCNEGRKVDILTTPKKSRYQKHIFI